MPELRFVGPDDGDHVLVESTDDGQRYRLIVDDALRTALKAPAPATTHPAVAVARPTISPREIQVRVRAGEDPAEIADEAGMEVDRVLVFAAPVIAERTRVADEARRARARRSSPDGQLVVFGESVDERFAAHGLDPLSVGWDSHRDEDGHWLVTATWRGGDSDRSAQWAFSLSSRTVTPLDETAADLLSDRPIRPIVAAVPDLPAVDAGEQTDAESPTGRLPHIDARDDVYDQDAVERSLAADSAATAREPNTFEHRTRSRATGAAKGTAEKLNEALPRAVPDSDTPVIHREQTELFTEPAALRLAPRPGPADAPATPAKAAGGSQPRARNARRPSAAATAVDEAESDEQKAERARIPSWDDILLGVRRKRD